MQGAALLRIDPADPFAPPPGLADPPIRRFAMADGAPGWLVTGYDLVRAVLADNRFSADRSRAGNPFRELGDTTFGSYLPGFFVSHDPPRHTRYRGLLTGAFTVRRMRAVTELIESYVDERLDAVEAAGRPADLVELFARPVPSMVICELLGVPYAERAEFQERTARLLRVDTGPAEFVAMFTEIYRFVLDLVSSGRAGAGLLAELRVADSSLSDEELANMGLLLLIAGHETTANMLGVGTYALLTHREQWDRLCLRPDLLPAAVEELLRYLSVVRFNVYRVAEADVTVGDARIAAGEVVVLYLPQANRDAARFERPDELDTGRDRVHHVAFGHGIHQCLGQQLSRVELVVAWRKLMARFPALRLAVPPGEVPLLVNSAVHGVGALPVTW